MLKRSDLVEFLYNKEQIHEKVRWVTLKRDSLDSNATKGTRTCTKIISYLGKFGLKNLCARAT